MTDSTAADTGVDEFVSIVGPHNVLTGVDALQHGVDFREIYRGEPVAVVRPADTAQVVEVVRACAARGTGIVPQGGNTSLSGGSVPGSTRRSIVLSLRRLDTIESIDADRYAMTVGAGCTIEQIQEAARQADRLFGPDWAARGSATIGGAIATNAGGNNVLRFGPMRDQILGLEVVLPDGRIWSGLRALRKDATGLDLKHLFIGSEGSLGVITRAVVSLEPARPHRADALLALDNPESLMPLYSLARAACGDSIVAFELLPEVGIGRACDKLGVAHPISDRREWYVLAGLAAASPVEDQLVNFIAGATDSGLAAEAVIAGTPQQTARLWTIRDELPATRLFPNHADACKWDAAVPIDHISRLIDEVRAAGAELAPDWLVYVFGHVGDGNLHVYLLPDPDTPTDGPEIKAALTDAIDGLIIAAGGTLSAEHGIGRELLDRVARQKTHVELELMRQIKNSLDPLGVMNPGVMLPPR